MLYDVYGPFGLPRTDNGFVDFAAKAKAGFWETVVEKNAAGLAGACGCYVFCVQTGGGRIPWYVGQTNRRTFEEECFGSHKVNHYNRVLEDYDKGNPVLFLIPRTTPKGKFCSPSASGYRDIDFLETHLISMALVRNPELRNKQDTKMLREVQVPGLLNWEWKPKTAASELRDTLGMSE